MADWRVYAEETKSLLNQKAYPEAQGKIQEGLDRFPSQAQILSAASDVYRAMGNRAKSLDFARGLIYHHPESWIGYGRAAQDLIALKRFPEGQSAIQEGLDKFPNQANMLAIAVDVYRASGNREKSLDFALGLIYHHPLNWIGYGRAAQDLVVLNRIPEAQAKIQEGLGKFPNHANLLSIASDVSRAAGDRAASLESACDLILHHPGLWIGYGRAAQDLIALKRFPEAQARIQEGLDQFPDQSNILSIASDVYRASGNREKSLDFALGLIYHHPLNWIGYGRAAQDLVALQRLAEAQSKIQEGLDRFPGHANLLPIANDVYRASGNREKALDFARGMMYYHSGSWVGYDRAAQDLAALNRMDEALSCVQEGLSRCPNSSRLQILSERLGRQAS